MGRPKITACKICGKEGMQLSTRKLCADCAINRQLEAARQIRNKSGHFYDLWLTGMVKAVLKGLERAEIDPDIFLEDKTNKNDEE